MDLEQVSYHTRHLKKRAEDLEKLIDVAKLETDVEIKKLDADDISKQFDLVERQLERLKRLIEK